MATRASAVRIKNAVLKTIQSEGSMVPSEISLALTNIFPHNTDWDFKRVIKEMQKDRLLIPDIIYGGLTLPRN